MEWMWGTLDILCVIGQTLYTWKSWLAGMLPPLLPVKPRATDSCAEPQA